MVEISRQRCHRLLDLPQDVLTGWWRGPETSPADCIPAKFIKNAKSAPNEGMHICLRAPKRGGQGSEEEKMVSR